VKNLLIAILTVLAVAGVVLMTTRCSLEQNMEEYQRSAVITEPDLSRLSDGDYKGSARNGIVSVKVHVTVADHQIREIQLLRHFNGQGGSAEVITDDVIRAQSLNVDMISGASYSSLVILKAVEDALMAADRR
jgi:uncharacterized protein with FMN-binding domain